MSNNRKSRKVKDILESFKESGLGRRRFLKRLSMAITAAGILSTLLIMSWNSVWLTGVTGAERKLLLIRGFRSGN